MLRAGVIFSALCSIAAAFSVDSSVFGIPGVNTTYDYVVVGAGNTGLALASLLAQDGRYSVAVVEAGGFYEIDNGNISIIAGDATYYAGAFPNDTQPLVDWGFVTTPQAGAANRSMHYARGKTMGGSSARHFMAYQRPTTGSMQLWADQVGDQSFTFNNTLPYFQKSAQVTLQDRSIRPNASNTQTTAGFVSTGGPLQVSYGNYVDAWATWTRQAFLNIGMKAIDGFNSGSLLGSAWMTWTIDPKTASRSSSESSYFQTTIKNTTKLTVYTRTLAERLLFDSNKTATGVLVSADSAFGTPPVNYVISAKREVIVSAGAFQSPQLLMVSGIGPRSTLAQYNIPLVKDAPGVGQNLWDQPYFGISVRVDLPTVSAQIYDPAQGAAAVEQWNKNASGPLSESASGYFGWEKVPSKYRSGFSNQTLAKLAQFPADWPEAEMFGINAYIGYQGNYQAGQIVDGTNYAGLGSALITPSSRGNVTIKSASMRDAPLINPNWLTDPADKEVAVALIKRQREVIAYLNQTGGVIYGQEVLPGPQVQSDADILNFVQHNMIEIWHAAATVKMGRANDTMAVVDTQGRVYGTQKLRVVDASIMPFLTPGHPQSVMYMLAEKVAAQILKGSS